MIGELPLGRGRVDAMGYQRQGFRLADPEDGLWVGHLVTETGRIAVVDGRLAQVTEQVAGEPYLLGRTDDDMVHVAWVVADFEVDSQFVPLTQIAAELTADESQLASRAVALAKWHADYRFCSRCGAPVVPVEAGWASLCAVCGKVEYPRIDPVVIMRITDADGRILLASNASWQAGRMSLPAGYVEAGEAPEQAVARETWEEVHLRVENPQYIASQVWPGPRSLMLAYSATVTGGRAEPVPDQIEVTAARFFSRKELEDALASGEVTGPGPSSIAYAVIQDWLDAAE